MLDSVDSINGPPVGVIGGVLTVLSIYDDVDIRLAKAHIKCLNCALARELAVIDLWKSGSGARFACPHTVPMRAITPSCSHHVLCVNVAKQCQPRRDGIVSMRTELQRVQRKTVEVLTVHANGHARGVVNLIQDPALGSGGGTEVHPRHPTPPYPTPTPSAVPRTPDGVCGAR